MIETPYGYEPSLSDQEFQTIGQFACRWAFIDHTIANCLRVMLRMEPEQATVMIYPLSMDLRMARMQELKHLHILTDYQLSLLAELKPLIKAMQFLRTTMLHGTVMDFGGDNATYFHLRSKSRSVNKAHLFECDDLINYTGHVVHAFRISLGDTDVPGKTYALPDRPPIREFLPKECRAFPKEDMALLRGRPKGSPQ
jgi:hypothetical protein